jgi:hypothetical protein
MPLTKASAFIPQGTPLGNGYVKASSNHQGTPFPMNRGPPNEKPAFSDLVKFSSVLWSLKSGSLGSPPKRKMEAGFELPAAERESLVHLPAQSLLRCVFPNSAMISL